MAQKEELTAVLKSPGTDKRNVIAPKLRKMPETIMASSKTAQLEERLMALETEVAQLKSRLADSAKPNEEATDDLPWWEKIAGRFANDPIYDEAMALGRAYRESLRPKPRKSAKKSNGRTRHRSSKSAGSGK